MFRFKPEKKEKVTTAEEVIIAVFDLLTKEEIESMLNHHDEKTVEDFGMKKRMLAASKNLSPKFSLEDSLAYANEVIKDIRESPDKDFKSSRYYLCKALLFGLFSTSK